MAILLLFLLTAFLPFSSATSLVISIPPSSHLPNPYIISSSTHATLLSGSPQLPALAAPLTTRSTLEFHNLTLLESALRPQSYLLTISALTHVFAPYRVDVIPGGSSGGAAIEGIWETYTGSPWSDKGPILGGKAAQGGGASGSVGSANEGSPDQEQEQVVRIDAKVLAKREFYEERAGFNPLGLLMNPMLLLGVVALGITFGMPYLMDNSTSMTSPALAYPIFLTCFLVCHHIHANTLILLPVDPELKAEFEEQKNNSPLSGMHRALQEAAGAGGAPSGVGGGSNFDLASWMAGTPKSQQGVTSGADVKEGGTKRR
jgi:ER membrane protein complex subunit 7